LAWKSFESEFGSTAKFKEWKQAGPANSANILEVVTVEIEISKGFLCWMTYESENTLDVAEADS